MELQGRVVVAPVIVSAGDEPKAFGGVARVLGGRRQWPSRELGVGDAPDRCAEALMSELSGEFGMSQVGGLLKPKLERDLLRVNFTTDPRGAVQFLYTLALPLGLLEVNAVKGAAVLPVEGIADPAAEGSQKTTTRWVAEQTRAFWRLRLSRTGGVIAFLPNWFTPSQARTIYDAVFEHPQNRGSWAAWAKKNLEDRVYTEVPASTTSGIRDHIQQELPDLLARQRLRVLSEEAIRWIYPTLTQKWPNLVGFSSGTLDKSSLPPPLKTPEVLAVLAGAVAYQPVLDGTPSVWLQRTRLKDSSKPVPQPYCPTRVPRSRLQRR